MNVMRELYDTISEKMAYDENKWKEFRLSLKSSLKRQFFEFFELGYSEREIAKKLFRSDIAIAPHRNVKHEIKTALYSELLKFKPSNYNYSLSQQAQYKAVQQHAVFKTLIYLGANQSVAALGENLLLRAMSYNFTDIIVDVSRRLCLYYSIKEIDNERLNKYSALHKKYSNILDKENIAEFCYAWIVSRSFGSAVDKDMAIKMAKKYIDANHFPIKMMDSHRFYLNHYLILLYHEELQNNYKAVEQITKEAYHHFCSLPYEHKVAKEAFIHKLIFSQFQLNKVNDSFTYLDQAIALSRKGHANWFISIELKLRALLSCNRYKEVQIVYQDMATQRNFVHQPLNHRIRWTLIGTYVQFLRKIELVAGEQPTTQFVNKHFLFLKENRNQLGEMKVPYIISQLLLSIYMRNYDEMEARIYALKSFCSTYLKKSTPNYRSSCFIKMLLLVPQCNFNSKVVERRASLYVRRLKEESFKIDPARIVEIIPYEELWSIILTHLSTPRRARKSEFNSKDWDIGKKKK